ncbi:MAG: cupin domain-containing protein [Nannocystaceae bacterium]|nr:cupin domain-containing protein [bacterium]
MTDADTFDPAVLDALVQGLEPSTPSASLRDRLFGALNTTARFLPFLDRMMRIFDLPEAQAKFELGTIDAPSEWDALTDGVSVRDFDAGDACGDAHGGLVRIEPGHAFPKHSHVGEETVLVLQGRLEDDQGKAYRAGDTIVSGDGSSHELRVVGDEAVLYAALVVAIDIESSPDGDDDWDDDEDLD